MANSIPAAGIFCLIALSYVYAQGNGVRYVILGNPGVGKSATLNGITGQTLFESRVFGSGLTQKVQKVQFGPDLFMDSPGLVDIKIKEEAANEIVSALKHGGDYKIIFILTVESCFKGRCKVRPRDKATIELVLNAAPDITDYGVIINKLEKASMKALQDRSDPTYSQLLASLMSGLPEKSLYIHLNPRSEFLADADNALMPDEMRKEILSFLHRVAPVKIQPEKVSAIHALSDKDFGKKRNDIEIEMEQASRSPEAIDNTMQDIWQQKSAQVEERDKRVQVERRSWTATIVDAAATAGGGIMSVLQSANEVIPMTTQVFRHVMDLAHAVKCVRDPSSCGMPYGVSG